MKNVCKFLITKRKIFYTQYNWSLNKNFQNRIRDRFVDSKDNYF